MNNTEIKNLIIRIYGLIINNKKEVLLSDEFQLGMKMTKFPGGGMKFGEGPADCIKREAMEEFGQEIDIISHFYTTDYFQEALFYKNHQLISIYYLVKFIDSIRFRVSTMPFDFEKMVNGSQSFRWKAIKDLNENDVSFPIDKKVVGLLKDKYSDLELRN